MSRSKTILRICELLAEEENLKVTIKEAAKGAGIIGVASFVGALLGGRRGLLAGAALGSAASMLVTSEFKSVVEIIRNDMTPSQRNELSQHIGNLFKGIQLQDAAAGMAVLTKNGDLKSAVINELVTFFRTEMDMNIS